MSQVATSTRGFRADVQGLRAVAVGAVLLYHAGVPPFSGGYVGVDVFFVISGFLISSHLLEALERDGRIGLARFYARRARRILPASLVVAAVTLVAAVTVAPPLALPGLLRDAAATVLYVPNIWFAVQDTDYLADHAASPFQHYWSLGVEEQFYLLWPLGLVVIALLCRRRRGRLTAAIGGLLLVSYIACILATTWNQPLAFFLLPTRAWELLAGAVVGSLVLGRRPRAGSVIAAAGGWAGLAAILAAYLLFDDTTTFPGAAAALPVVGTAAVIYFGSTATRGGPEVLLALRPMQWVGLISYSLYLVHWPLLIVPQLAQGGRAVAAMPVWVSVLWGIVLAVPLAVLLHRYVEEPARTARVLASRPPRVTLLATGAVTLTLVAVVAGIGVWSAHREITGAADAPPAPAVPASPPVGAVAVPANLTPSLRDVADDVPDVYKRDGCHLDTVETAVQNCAFGDSDAGTEVALFGDSHSAQWLPAVQRLATEHDGVEIRTYTKSSCPAVEVTVLVKNAPYGACDTWREAVIEQLVSSPVDLVIISSYSAYALSGDPVGDERTQQWGAGLARTLERLRAAGMPVLVIADTPRFATAPPECLSAHLGDAAACAGEPMSALDAALAAEERRVASQVGAQYADLTPYLCGESCPVVIGDLLVYRDVNHLTATFARYLAPVLPVDLP